MRHLPTDPLAVSALPPVTSREEYEAAGFSGYGAEIAARLTEQCFFHLEAPVLRVTGLDIPYPPPHLEQYHLPSTDRILDAIARLAWE